MALIKCPECGKEISDKASTCPHCGFEISKQRSRGSNSPKKWLVFLIIGILVLAFTALWFFVYRDSGEDSMESKVEQSVITKNSEIERTFLSQDLRMYDLFGPVKDFSTKISDVNNDGTLKAGNKPYDDYLSLQFKNDGSFVKKIDEGFTVDDITKRDGDRIMEAKSFIQEFNIYVSKQWFYYPNGMVQQSIHEGLENYVKYVYHYDNNNELLKMEVFSAAEGTNIKSTVTYTIKQRDDYGNWIVRMAEIADQEYVLYGDGREEYYPAAVRYEMHNRVIHYY